MVSGVWVPLVRLTFDLGGDSDVCDVGDDRLQGIGDRTMAGNLFLGILSRLGSPTSFLYELTFSQSFWPGCSYMSQQLLYGSIYNWRRSSPVHW